MFEKPEPVLIFPESTKPELFVTEDLCLVGLDWWIKFLVG